LTRDFVLNFRLPFTNVFFRHSPVGKHQSQCVLVTKNDFFHVKSQLYESNPDTSLSYVFNQGTNTHDSNHFIKNMFGFNLNKLQK
jgi:hypothetical protein